SRGHRRPVPRDRAESRARDVDRVRGRQRPARVREARLDQPTARHVSVHQPAGAESAVDDGRGIGRALPRRSRAPRRGRAADRPRVRLDDAADRHPVSRGGSGGGLTVIPRIGALIIGDEILSGKRADAHLAHVIATIWARGLALAWARYEGDDRARLTAVLRETFASGDLVFAFGGVGATPDDHTRQAAAAALGVPLARHPDALAEIEARFGKDAYPYRVLMADFPQGSSIIPNPVNRIASFSIRGHHFFPGFRQRARPMLDWVLATRYEHLVAAPTAERAIVVRGAGESQ